MGLPVTVDQPSEGGSGNGGNATGKNLIPGILNTTLYKVLIGAILLIAGIVIGVIISN